VKKRVAVEMGSPFGWDRYVGPEGKVIALNRLEQVGKAKKLLNI
jgi:Transketolase